LPDPPQPYGQVAPVLIQAWTSAPAMFCVPGAGWRPKPGAQAQPTSVFRADMMYEVFGTPAAVALRVLDLGADLANRLSLPRHLDRREVPFGVAGHASRLEIGALVADRAAQR